MGEFEQRLISDLKTLTEIESSQLDIQLEPLQPSLLKGRIFHACQPIVAPRNIELQLDAPNSQAPVLVDEGRMLQVLRNLVDNALRYTPDGGWIKLSVSYDDQVHLSVMDSGSGIDLENLPFVFDRCPIRRQSEGHNDCYIVPFCRCIERFPFIFM